MEQKTYDGQTAKFIAVVLENMPRNLTSDVMQGWIQNPGALQIALNDALCPTEIEAKPEKRWTEKDGIIYLSVTSDGTIGPEWVKRIREKGLDNTYTEMLLLSKDFKPTTSVIYNLAILKGELFENRTRTTKEIWNMANQKGYDKPNAEVACLIREQFSDEELKEMGLSWIVTLHDPELQRPYGSDPNRHIANFCCQWGGCHGHSWIRVTGFAFVASSSFAKA